MHMLGIHGDPVAAKKAMDKASRTRIRIDGNAEWSFEFNGTPEEATHLRGFIKGQWRRSGQWRKVARYRLSAPLRTAAELGCRRRGLDRSPHPGWPQRPDRHDPPGAHQGCRGAGMTQAIASGRPAYELRSRQRGPSDLELEVWQVPSTATPELKEPAGWLASAATNS